jgi:hypothetical protein
LLLLDLLDDWLEQAPEVEWNLGCQLGWHGQAARGSLELLDESDESIEKDHVIRADCFGLEAECFELRQVADHVGRKPDWIRGVRCGRLADLDTELAEFIVHLHPIINVRDAVLPAVPVHLPHALDSLPPEKTRVGRRRQVPTRLRENLDDTGKNFMANLCAKLLRRSHRAPRRLVASVCHSRRATVRSASGSISTSQSTLISVSRVTLLFNNTAINSMTAKDWPHQLAVERSSVSYPSSRLSEKVGALLTGER